MYIYSISDSENKNIYIGKTNNVKKRMYVHKSKSRYSHTKLYKWINEVGWNNLIITCICECGNDEAFDKEIFYIKNYEEKGFNLLNEQHTNQYNPLDSIKMKIESDSRVEIWNAYKSGQSRRNICLLYNISDSMLSKVIAENGGTNRTHKLEPYYRDIQKSIINGVPIRKLARQYGVCKNSISNINKGITAYNPKLNYPLNKN